MLNLFQHPFGRPQSEGRSGPSTRFRVTVEVRIDRYLHCIRLVKSRTLAQAVIESGHVRIDGKRVTKPSDEVRVGSIVALPLHGTVRVLRVVALPERRGPAPEARSAYEELGIDEPKPAP